MRLHLRECLAFVILNLLFFQSSFESIWAPFGQLDEFIAAVILIAIIAVRTPDRSNRVGAVRRHIIVLIVLFVLFGLAGNYFSDLNTAHFAIVVDIATSLRFIIVFLCVLQLPLAISELHRMLIVEAKVFIGIMTLLALANQFYDIGMASFGDFGVERSFAFVFSHPGTLSWFAVTLTSIVVDDVKHNWLYFGAGVLVVLSTLTGKGMGWALIAILYLAYTRLFRRVNVGFILLAGVCGAIGAWGSLRVYYFASNATSARAILLRDSIILARERFPLGTGFGTFGSAVTQSSTYYSDLYYRFGYNGFWGLSPSKPTYLTDTMVPSVLGQHGILGTLVLAVILLECWKLASLTRRSEIGVHSLPAGVVLIAVFLAVTVLSETSIFNPSAVYVAIVLGIMIRSKVGESS